MRGGGEDFSDPTYDSHLEVSFPLFDSHLEVSLFPYIILLPPRSLVTCSRSRWGPAAMPVRWAGEQVVETVPVQITKELEVKEVLLVDDNLRSPGGSKPMQRKYKYQSTPEAAEFD